MKQISTRRDGRDLALQICRDLGLDFAAIDGLSPDSLWSIQAGVIPERDARRLLAARHEMLRRLRRR